MTSTPDWFPNYLAALSNDDRLGVLRDQRVSHDDLGEQARLVRRPAIPVWIRVGVIERDVYCSSCGRAPYSIEIDHIIPWSKGGSHGSTNLRLLCRGCNQTRKADFDPVDAVTRLPIAWSCPDDDEERTDRIAALREDDDSQITDTDLVLVPCYCLQGAHKSATTLDKLCDTVRSWNDVPYGWQRATAVHGWQADGGAMAEIVGRSSWSGYLPPVQQFHDVDERHCEHGAVKRHCALCRRR